MKIRNYWLLTAALLCLFTAALHLIGGQIDLVNPMMNSDLQGQVKTELLGLWHMVTGLLFISTFILINGGFDFKAKHKAAYLLISALFIFSAGSFVFAGIYTMTFAPQWILLLPIGILTWVGARKG